MATKYCTKCEKELSVEHFYKRSDGKGYRVICKKCHNNFQDVMCPVCGTIHNRYGTKRKSDACENCYEKYRQAQTLFYSSEYRAKQKDLSFNLTIEWILSNLVKCPKTNLNFTFSENGSSYSNRSPTTPSIDKINPLLGYTKDNCQIVCWWYNSAKQQFSDEEVLNLCKAVVTTSLNTKPVQNVGV